MYNNVEYNAYTADTVSSHNYYHVIYLNSHLVKCNVHYNYVLYYIIIIDSYFMIAIIDYLIVSLVCAIYHTIII